MEILIDYDNVPYQIRKAGVVDLITRVINTIALRKKHFPEKCRVRLYGGWYENQSMTQQANELVVDIDAAFPRVVGWVCDKCEGKSRVDAQIAKSVEADPARTLFHTRRRRPLDEKIFPKNNLSGKCLKVGCNISVIANFFQNKKCSEATCYITPNDILTKDEQKMVDAMLIADLIHFAKIGFHDIAVVSSDDDLWPGMHVALAYGARVIQVHTRKIEHYNNLYCQGLKQYKFTSL